MPGLPFVAPHLHSHSLFDRYTEGLMTLTYQKPAFMRNLIYGAAGISAGLVGGALLASGWGAALLASAGVLGSLASVGSGILQHKIFGFPVTNEAVFRNNTVTYKTATAQIIVNDKDLPLLELRAKESFDAGYVEGYILGETIQASLKKINFLYKLVRPLIGAPKKDEDLLPFLEDVLKTIPSRYIEEMRGKVAGYNAWLKACDHTDEPLAFEKYFLLQLLPDFLNYNPFSKKKLPDLVSSLACTTAAFRIGDYTFITRILDWPAYGFAGKYFLQMDRTIDGAKRTIDIGSPLISGELTTTNENGVFIEMNVSKGEKVGTPKGMPAIFFNRYCAEHANSVSDINEILKHERPLNAYHLTASDGHHTQSFHFYQNTLHKGEDDDEVLFENKKVPQLLTVANNGIVFEGDKLKEINYDDSNERRQNINAFFKQAALQDQFAEYIKKQENGSELSLEDIHTLKEVCLGIARLALVNNCESQLCGIYVYYQNHLIDACANADNLYAPNKDLEEFKTLRIVR